MPRDYYQILGVGRSSSLSEIKESYRRLAIKYHPDKNPADHVAGRKFIEVAEAYWVLSDTEKRASYDRFGHQGLERFGLSPFHTSQDILKAFSRDIFSGKSFAHFFDRGEGLPVKKKMRILPIASGKGGVGKTVVAANLGLALASLGYKVIMMDADLGIPNLDLRLGVGHIEHTLDDFLKSKGEPGRVDSLSQILTEIPGSPGAKFIAGGSMPGMANLKYQKKQRLFRHLSVLEADFLLIDLSPGINYNTLDAYLQGLDEDEPSSRREGIIVTNPDPAATKDARTFINCTICRQLQRKFHKNSLVQHYLRRASDPKDGHIGSMLDVIDCLGQEDPVTAKRVEDELERFEVKLLINRIRDKWTADRIAEDIISFSQHLLKVKVEYLGYIESSIYVEQATIGNKPFVTKFPYCKPSREILEIARRLSSDRRPHRLMKFFQEIFR